MKQVLRLENPRSANEGATFAFDAVTDEGTETFAAPTADIGEFLAFFAQVALAVGEVVPGPPTNDLVPIPARGLGFQSGVTPDTNMLVLNVAGHGLAFEIDRRTLSDDMERAARTAKTLSAGGKPQ